MLRGELQALAGPFQAQFTRDWYQNACSRKHLEFAARQYRNPFTTTAIATGVNDGCSIFSPRIENSYANRRNLSRISGNQRQI